MDRDNHPNDDLLQKARRIGSLLNDNPHHLNIDKYLAYIAGLFDAEVAIMIQEGSLSIGYSKSSRLILDYLRNIFGGKVSSAPRQSYDRYPRYQWQLRPALAYSALCKLYPFLRRKKESARIFIESYESWCNSGRSRSTQKQVIPGRKDTDLLIKYQSKLGSQGKVLTVRWVTPEGITLNDYRLPDISLPVCDLAYWAGLFDGQASFLIYRQSNSQGYCLQIAYRSSYCDTIKEVADVFEGNVKPQKPSKNKDIWEVTFTSRKAYRILVQISPFLIVRKEAAEIGMRFLEQYWQPFDGKPIAEERKLIGVKYEALMKEHHLKSWPRS